MIAKGWGVNMEKLRSRRESNPGNNNTFEKQRENNSTKTAASQRQIILAYLQQHGSITTLEARNQLYIMGIAARIWELKHNYGWDIHTVRVPANFGGTRLIARYVLLKNGENQ